jgi:hypothetical protein
VSSSLTCIKLSEAIKMFHLMMIVWLSTCHEGLNQFTKNGCSSATGGVRRNLIPLGTFGYWISIPLSPFDAHLHGLMEKRWPIILAFSPDYELRNNYEVSVFTFRCFWLKSLWLVTRMRSAGTEIPSVSHFVIARCGWVVSSSASYSWGYRFTSRPGNRLCWPRFIVDLH